MGPGQSYIAVGIEEGAKLIAGGPGKPDGLEIGYFVRPTVFSDVGPDMRIAQEEIFGPVLSIIPYDTEEEAIEIANDSEYGLAGGVWAGDQDHGIAVARRIRTGQVEVNGGAFNPNAPFGGYKQSGIGREYGHFGLEEFLQVRPSSSRRGRSEPTDEARACNSARCTFPGCKRRDFVATLARGTVAERGVFTFAVSGGTPRGPCSPSWPTTTSPGLRCASSRSTSGSPGGRPGSESDSPHGRSRATPARCRRCRSTTRTSRRVAPPTRLCFLALRPGAISGSAPMGTPPR